MRGQETLFSNFPLNYRQSLNITQELVCILEAQCVEGKMVI